MDEIETEEGPPLLEVTFKNFLNREKILKSFYKKMRLKQKKVHLSLR